MINTDFAGRIEEILEKLCIDAREFLARITAALLRCGPPFYFLLIVRPRCDFLFCCRRRNFPCNLFLCTDFFRLWLGRYFFRRFLFGLLRGFFGHRWQRLDHRQLRRQFRRRFWRRFWRRFL